MAHSGVPGRSKFLVGSGFARTTPRRFHGVLLTAVTGFLSSGGALPKNFEKMDSLSCAGKGAVTAPVPRAEEDRRRSELGTERGAQGAGAPRQRLCVSAQERVKREAGTRRRRARFPSGCCRYLRTIRGNLRK